MRSVWLILTMAALTGCSVSQRRQAARIAAPSAPGPTVESHPAPRPPNMLLLCGSDWSGMPLPGFDLATEPPRDRIDAAAAFLFGLEPYLELVWHPPLLPPAQKQSVGPLRPPIDAVEASIIARQTVSTTDKWAERAVYSPYHYGKGWFVTVHYWIAAPNGHGHIGPQRHVFLDPYGQVTEYKRW